MSNRPPYPCTGCTEVFDTYAAYDAHRSSVHGRRADGTLLRPDGTPYAPRLTLEQRIDRMEHQIADLAAEIAALKKAGKP